jgi:acetyltransferase
LSANDSDVSAAEEIDDVNSTGTGVGRGLGSHLLEALVHIGRAEKTTRITGTILQSNHAMLDLCRRLGFKLHRDPDDDDVSADLTL